MPKISVIIPVYNAQKYLRACLDSVLNQDFDSYEVLLVDDGSTDNSAGIAKDYQTRYPDQIRLLHQENQGQGIARNAGMECAKGEFFVFVDSDDTIEPDMLSGLYREAEQRGVPLVICGWDSLAENGDVFFRETGNQPKHRKLDFRNNKEILIETPSPCNKLFHRDLFMKTRIRFPGGVWYEDFRTITKVYLAADGISEMENCFYHYYQHTGSTMRNINLRKNMEILDAMEDILSYYKSQGVYEMFRDELEFLVIYHVLIAASVRILRIDPKSALLSDIREYVEKTVPHFRNNRYLKTLDRKKKLAYQLLLKKKYYLLFLLFKIKG